MVLIAGQKNQKPLSIYLVAICGTGMGSLAALLKRAGHTVAGSDREIYPPMSDQLQAAGVTIKKGYEAANLPARVDLVVVGNAISRGNAEVVAAEARGVPCWSMSQTLRHFFLTGREPLVVTGTHGKTTTSFLLRHVLAAGGRDPGSFIGGVLADGSSGARLGSGMDFVVEGDEYDDVYWDKSPKFLHYGVHSAIFTAIEHDHADIYPTVEAYQARFAELAATIPDHGLLIASSECWRVRQVITAARCKVETYGTNEGDPWRLTDIEEDADGATFTIIMRGRGKFTGVRLPLPGEYNAHNALAAVAMAVHRGVEPRAAVESLASFPCVRRRQEVLGEVDGILVIDDFAHHPTAVLRTLQGIHERYLHRQGRVWAIFEPRSATSCRRVHQNDYEAAFDAANKVIIAPNARQAKLAPGEGLDTERLAGGLRGLGMDAMAAKDLDVIVKRIATEATCGDVVVFLSNGGFGGIQRRVLDALGDRRAPATKRSVRIG